ncbi:CIA30 family protein-like protein [Pyronema omphalodes]|nr:CIA30 family protein-like protein [Pyronema omphalodes]
MAPLFPPWNQDDWVPQDDSLRGGVSNSKMIPNSEGTTATFMGKLDSRKLGGAGFASVMTTGVRNWDWTMYEGLKIRIQKADHKIYSIILKNDVPDDKTDSRERSTISYEYHFSHHNKQPAIVLARFEDFTPFYRGRLARDAPPLDLKHVKRLSIMCRSFFGRLEQEGEFRIEFKGFDTYRAKKDKGKMNAEGMESVEGEGEEAPIDMGEENKSSSEEDWEMVSSSDLANANPGEADKTERPCSVM